MACSLIRRALAAVCLLSALSPVWVVARAQEGGEIWRSSSGQVTLGAGMRFDNLDWNIADSDGSPNILSELRWQDMRTPFVSLLGEWKMSHLRLRLEGNFGKVAAGDNIDSDYNADNRGSEFSRSENDAGGEVAGASGAIGYSFSFVDSSVFRPFYVTPWIGYGGQWQWLSMTNGYQVIPATGAFGGLDSSYDAQWTGVLFGIGFDGGPRDGTNVHMDFTYYPVLDYHADADWNLRADLQHPVSYTHDADASGLSFKLGVTQSLAKSLTLYLDYQRFVFEAEAGIDKTYNSNGTTATTRLNEVNWDTSIFTIGLGYKLW